MYQDINLFIRGDWRPASDKAARPVTDPANEEPLAQVAFATEADIEDALIAAKDGFAVWRRTGPWERAVKIRRAADLIRERADELGLLMSMETGKPIAEGKGEINAAADQFEWYSEETKRIYGQMIEARTHESRMAVIYQPVGVVAAFSAWNFPALLPARKIGAALAAGCSIIIKPASETPASCAGRVAAGDDAAIPAGGVNRGTGNSARIADQLIRSPIVRKVSLTGSVPVGKQVLALAAEGVKKVSMELGGHGPVVVFNDFDPVAAA